MNLNIAINVGGYHSIGTGHTYRQITMMEEKPEFNYFFFINKSQDLAKKLLEENLINYYVFSNENEFINKLKNLNIHIVINDFLDTEKNYIEQLKNLNYFVINFEDRGTGIKYADIVINDMYDIKSKLNNIYTGYEYTCMRRDLKLYSNLKYNEEVKNIIITFGGSDPQNFTKQVLDLILEENIANNINITFILGLGYKLEEEIYKYQSGNIKVLKNIKNMPALLQKADIGITANGRTLFEFSHFRIPCISLAQNDREKIHTFAKEENGVIFLGEKEDFTINDLKNAINKLIYNNDYRKKLSNNMNNAYKILENSNKNIWNLILKKYKYKNNDIILQCRLNSKRLPNKAIKKIGNKTLIEHIIMRLKKCNNIDNLILCTSINKENDILIDISKKYNIKYFRGSEDNVLERYYECAKEFKSKNIIRCTGDCPLIDSILVDELIEEFIKKKHNHLNFRNKDITRNNNFPDGFDAEIFTYNVLKEAYENDNTQLGKEHVTPYIVKKYGKNYFKISKIENYNINLSNFHYSVDTEEDFNKVSNIYNKLYINNKNFGLYDLLDYINMDRYIKILECPNCSNDNIKKYSENKDFINLLICMKCNLIFNDKILKEKEFISQYNNYNNDRIENIKILSTYENRKNQYNLDYNFIKKHIDFNDFNDLIILDFGCGTGEFLDKFPNCSKYGIDVDNTFDEILKEKGIIKIEKIDERLYDIIIFRGTFQYIRNLKDTINYIKKSIKENGYLIFLQIPNSDSQVFDLLKDNWSLCNKEEFLHYWNINIIKKTFENFHKVAEEYPYKETSYFNKNDIIKLIKSYNDKEKLKFAFHDNMFNLILKNNKISQEKYLSFKKNIYKTNNILFDDTEYYIKNTQIVKELCILYDSINNNASGDWKWISENKYKDIDLYFKQKNLDKLEELYSNLARNNLSFGIISNGIYEKLKNDNELLENFKQSILNDIDTCIELCEINDLNILESERIGNFYGIKKNNIFITSDNIRHYYCAYKINTFLSQINYPIIMEIGGGYGGLLINLLKIMNKKFCYINVDIKNTLLVFYYYIKNYININKLELKIFFGIDQEITNEIIKNNDIILICNDNQKKIKCKIDLVFNSHSLSEMSKYHMEEYFETIHKLKIKHIFHINSIYFPWKKSDRGHIQISTKNFPINNESYKKIYQCISPWMCGSGRYREFYYLLRI